MRVRAIIISADSRLLLGVNHDGCYVLPGGKIKPKEHPVDALLREVKEETGINDFESIEYLWPFLGNHVFIFVPKDTIMQPSCSNDPSNEFRSLEWFKIEALPSNMDDYSEDIIYRFLRIEILQKGKEDTMRITIASHIDVLVDGEKAFQLDDDTIWLTLPRLAQERSKGKKIEFKQVLDDGTVVDQTPNPQPAKEENLPRKEVKEPLPKEVPQKPKVESHLKENDLQQFNKCILLDINSELLNPSVQVLKLADTFDNSLLFDGKDEFWITHCCQPVWRSNYLDRYAPYEEIVQKWNDTYPKHIIDLDWFKGLLKKMVEKKVKKKS